MESDYIMKFKDITFLLINAVDESLNLKDSLH